MDAFQIGFIVLIILLGIVLGLETYQYGRVLRTARMLDTQDVEYRSLINELGHIVNNNAEILKGYAETIDEHQDSIELLQLQVKAQMLVVNLLLDAEKLKETK